MVLNFLCWVYITYKRWDKQLHSSSIWSSLTLRTCVTPIWLQHNMWVFFSGADPVSTQTVNLNCTCYIRTLLTLNVSPSYTSCTGRQFNICAIRKLATSLPMTDHPTTVRIVIWVRLFFWNWSPVSTNTSDKLEFVFDVIKVSWIFITSTLLH